MKKIANSDAKRDIRSRTKIGQMAPEPPASTESPSQGNFKRTYGMLIVFDLDWSKTDPNISHEKVMGDLEQALLEAAHRVLVDEQPAAELIGPMAEMRDMTGKPQGEF